MAPEVIQGGKRLNGGGKKGSSGGGSKGSPTTPSYGPACDLWSCGVILYMLLSGEAPFGGESQPRLLRAIVAGKYELSGGAWKAVSHEAKDLISKLLVVDPTKRLTCQAALQHPWLRRSGVREQAKQLRQQQHAEQRQEQPAKQRRELLAAGAERKEYRNTAVAPANPVAAGSATASLSWDFSNPFSRAGSFPAS